MPSSSGSTRTRPHSAAGESAAAPCFTAGRLAGLLHGELRGPADLAIEGVNSLDAASEREITFLADAAHAGRWAAARAAAAVVSAGLEPQDHDPRTRALIIVPSAARAMIDVITLFAPTPHRPET